MVVTGVVTMSNLISDCGLVAPEVSDTVAALFVNPVSLTYWMAFEAVFPGVSRSRMVMRRWAGVMMPSTRCGTIRSPAEPLASVVRDEMIALTAMLIRPLPPPAMKLFSSSLSATIWPADLWRSSSRPSGWVIFCSMTDRRSLISLCLTSASSAFCLVSSVTLPRFLTSVWVVSATFFTSSAACFRSLTRVSIS
ncbi:hypothetical protein BRDI103020_17125 [Brevundimonas diminuta]